MIIELDDYHFLDSDRITRPNPVMLEVGAFSGDLAFEFLRNYPAGRVIVYEADATNFASLRKSVNEDSRITLHYAALAGRNGTIHFNTYMDRAANSLFDRNCDDELLRRRYVVPCTTLAAALEVNRLADLDFLLLNCEGGELFALDELAGPLADVRDTISQVCVSFHCLHSRMYPVARRDALLTRLQQWFTLHLGNMEWEYFLLTKRNYDT